MSTVTRQSKLELAAQRLREIISRYSDVDTQRCRLATQALSRIKDRTFGYCMQCYMQIPEREIDLTPERRCCSRCQVSKAG